MHEISFIECVIALVEQERQRQSFSQVMRICLQVGALGCADPAALRFCFEAVASGTIADGADLEIDTVPGEGFCADCADRVPLAERFGACPLCGGHRVKMTAGDALRLTELEVA
jgi:hydrogenase nickel incorporation protein HypA/HybF